MVKEPASRHLAQARRQLLTLRGNPLSDAQLCSATVEVVECLLSQALVEQSAAEREQAEMLSALMRDDAGQAFTTLLTDRVYRSGDPGRVVSVARELVRHFGVPSYLPRLARLQLLAFRRLGRLAPASAAKGLLERLAKESRHVVLPAEDPELSRYLASRRAERVRVNLNHLGEAVLGEREAARRIEDYCALLARPDVESISVKVSSIFSQIDLLAFEASVTTLSDRLATIYRTALQTASGTRRPKLVNLDMEAYRDLDLTVQAFTRALEADGLLGLTAGIALQAYLPESPRVQRELIAWAQRRRARGGAPIRLRIVKGANLLTERAEASIRGWAVPVLPTKAEVDANFKKMLDQALTAENTAAVSIGVASHNLFDLAYAMVLGANRGLDTGVGFELLEGMADHVRRAVAKLTGDTLVYAPVVDAASMQTAIAYLVRRLDENTAPENFLRNSLHMRPGDATFAEQRRRFEQAVAERGDVDERPLRERPPLRGWLGETPPASKAEHAFHNEPDTDFARAPNRAALDRARARWQQASLPPIGSIIDGDTTTAEPTLDGFDPSRPGFVPYRVALADAETIERALSVAHSAAAHSAGRPVGERAAILLEVARLLREGRPELVCAIVLDGGKRVTEADAEVSEAIDFAEYYARSMLAHSSEPDVSLSPRGVVLVTPPWNFPLAIPCGGVMAAFVAGNAVILKPALETPLVAERLVRLCHRAGIPKDALTLLLTEDELGSRLIADPRVDQVVLTGATATAHLFKRLRPGLELAAETGGKNAIVVSALSDRDEAIRDAVHSAFGHAGQKCSACSLLVCEAEVYDDPDFLATLADAAESLPVGSAWDPRSVVTPLIAAPQGALERALTTLEPGERWLVEPHGSPDNPRLWTPGIKLDVREGGFSHQTELFGPILAVMRARDLDHAIEIVNGTPYGLTAGLHSLDEREQRPFVERVRAGNLYLNRPITGAIVQRQPFGGIKASASGPGAKAGGPNYVVALSRVTEGTAPTRPGDLPPTVHALLERVREHTPRPSMARLSAAARDYAAAFDAHFARDVDPSGVLGERNISRYLPCERLLIRAEHDAVWLDVVLAVAAALTVGARFELSVDEAVAPTLGEDVLEPYGGHVETPAASAARAATRDRIRVLGSVSEAIRDAANTAGVYVASDPVLARGRYELPRYLWEQSISHRYHRFGNLAPERLLPPLGRAQTR